MGSFVEFYCFEKLSLTEGKKFDCACFFAEKSGIVSLNLFVFICRLHFTASFFFFSLCFLFLRLAYKLAKSGLLNLRAKFAWLPEIQY